MQTFSIRDLRDRSGELTREAEEGRMSLVTKHGKPLLVSVPFTQELIELGVLQAVARNLYRTGNISLEKAAKFAQMNVDEFKEQSDVSHTGASL
jgi:antitoxin (DNA-binding transcriptional repressor) of toxin-antitoxin stability system